LNLGLYIAVLIPPNYQTTTHRSSHLVGKLHSQVPQAPHSQHRHLRAMTILKISIFQYFILIVDGSTRGGSKRKLDLR
jgi:hypothetical protein